MNRTITLLLVCYLAGCGSRAPNDEAELESGFDYVRISEFAPDIQIDARYVTDNNFIGRPIRGYGAAECILSRRAAEALVHAQAAAVEAGYSLKVYDCYRPQRAVDDFVEWGKALADTTMKHRFYPDVPKDELFERGYIAERSGHTRGSTADLTLVPLGSQPNHDADPMAGYDCRSVDPTGRYPDNTIDMGAGYDCFDALSHTASPEIPAEPMARRMLLKSIMEDAGFVNYENEWWHYTLADEPYPDTYFDVPVD